MSNVSSLSSVASLSSSMASKEFGGEPDSTVEVLCNEFGATTAVGIRSASWSAVGAGVEMNSSLT